MRLKRYDIPFAIAVLFLLLSIPAMASANNLVFGLGITFLVAGGGLLLLILNEAWKDIKQAEEDYKLKELANLAKTIKDKKERK